MPSYRARARLRS